MKPADLVAISLLFPALFRSAAALASAACPAGAQSLLSRSEVRLIVCERERNLYFVLQDYLGEEQEYAGLTLSVYDVAGFSSASKPLAIATGLGDRSLNFRIEGRTVNHWMLKPDRINRSPGILFRAFNPPRVGLFVAFRYDSVAKSLDLQSAEATSDAGIVPEIRPDGTLTITGESFDEDGIAIPYTKTYRYKDGSFTLKD